MNINTIVIFTIMLIAMYQIIQTMWQEHDIVLIGVSQINHTNIIIIIIVKIMDMAKGVVRVAVRDILETIETETVRVQDATNACPMPREGRKLYRGGSDSGGRSSGTFVSSSGRAISSPSSE